MSEIIVSILCTKPGPDSDPMEFVAIISDSNIKKSVRNIEEYLVEFEHWDPRIIKVRQIINGEEINIYYKYHELINRRANARQKR